MGLQQILLAVGSLGTLSSLTAAVSGSNCGYYLSLFGAMSPIWQAPKAPTYNITGLYNPGTTYDLELTLPGTYTGGQTGAFTGVNVTDHTGAVRNYTAAGANFINAFTWTWGSGSNGVWTSAGTFNVWIY